MKNIELKLLPSAIAGGIIGSLFGANIAVVTKALLLKKIFAILLFSIGIYEIFSKPKK
jgi:uncharacterized membrane protein YfcA